MLQMLFKIKKIKRIIKNSSRNVHDGLHIMKFINAAVDSSNNNSKWTDLSTIK